MPAATTPVPTTAAPATRGPAATVRPAATIPPATAVRPDTTAVHPTSAPAVPAAASCAANLAGQLASTGGARQLITVDAPTMASTTATVALWQRSGACWSEVAGPWSGRVGYNGLSDHHREGDGTTPTGLYAFGPTMYGLAADPGVRYGYRQLLCGDWWDGDPASGAYNTFQHVPCGVTPPFGGGSEALWQQTTAYRSFAVIQYNAGPVVAGAGSAIFFHDDTGGATNGCVSVPAADLVAAIRWLQPALSPLIAIGTDAQIRRF